MQLFAYSSLSKNNLALLACENRLLGSFENRLLKQTGLFWICCHCFVKFRFLKRKDQLFRAVVTTSGQID